LRKEKKILHFLSGGEMPRIMEKEVRGKASDGKSRVGNEIGNSKAGKSGERGRLVACTTAMVLM
jgi:hypothetical protein